MADRRAPGAAALARLTAHMNPQVFFGAGGAVAIFCLFGGVFTETAQPLFQSLQDWISSQLGWYYLLLVSGILVFAVWLAFSRVGRIRLGGPDAKPEFSRFSWLAMLFTGGMGIGLVFWSVAEPLTHYAAPLESAPETEAALREAMRLTFFHWGLHAWGLYTVLALAVAYFHFNRNLPLAPRSVFLPLLGKRINGPLGDLIDGLAVVGTLLGVATSLGLGAQQINAGLTLLAPIQSGVTVQVMLIAGITALATISVVLGVQAGIRRLSRFNAVLAVSVFAFVLIVGPTVFVMEVFVSSLGSYLQTLPAQSLYMDLGSASPWQADWTLFYWGWWISWSPFVAIFVARISRGRTVRDFILSVLIVPSLVTFLWLSVFGGTALSLSEAGAGNLADQATETPAIALHALLGNLPLAGLMQGLATLLIVVFFVTSSDSGSLVNDMIASGGDPDPPRWQRVFWATAEGVAAMTLLVVGGLQAMRNASIALGLPMSLLLIGAAVSLQTALGRDTQVRPRPRAAARRR